LDLEDNTKALRITLAISKRLLDEALRGSDERKIALRQRNYERCFELLRKAEWSLNELQKARGQLIDREQVTSDLTKLAEVLRQMRVTMATRVLSHLGGDLSPELAERLSRAIVREREAEDRIFRNLRLEGTAETTTNEETKKL